jgi:hypothetical protein
VAGQRRGVVRFCGPTDFAPGTSKFYIDLNIIIDNTKPWSGKLPVDINMVAKRVCKI